ncbi:choice-of-anchor L domain-containing protein [Nannocystis sp. SCPEA4]|uniref:choice-of-anchor L domain-containing protein n=1 Tax=Nannocystis sp. SCPEA4 TaxID=2996787 RepID=UPI00226DFADB|nr:choice-of-anchor L domain-containing protein [Nannocystis sp. SCPEA4]MCY1059574.1 choice-of-anchor L domain-containing protein [Nannocystis sp. SCPEA4]
MTQSLALRLVCLASVSGLACSTADPGLTAGVSATDSDSGLTSLTTGDDSPTTQAQPTGDTNPTDGGTMSAGETMGTTGVTTDAPDTTGVDTTGTPVTSSTGEDTTGDDTTSTTTGDDTTTGTTTGDDTTTTDGTTGDVDPNCQAPATQPPCDEAGDDIFKAIGLNCSDDKSMAIPISNPVINAPDAASYRVISRFGSAMDPMDPAQFAWRPHEGSRMLAITTGRFPALQGDGGLVEPNNGDSEGNNNPDNLANLPGVMHWNKGSNNGQGGTPFMNCDGVNDCSDSLDPQWNIAPFNVANDVFYMSFDLETPLGTHGYLFDFAYFSEEWPNYVNDSFNDMLVVWSTSETFTGNVTFINDQPLTVTALDPYMMYLPGDPLLAGTGFPGDGEGAGTGWFTAKGSAAPGENFTIAISIFDMSDTVWDTTGLIDKFRWDCEGCIPSEVMSCGIEPQ